MNKRLVWSAAAVLMSLAPLMGCQNEGPAERAGKGMDNAVRDVKDTIKPPGAVEKAGRAVDDAVNQK